MIHIKQHDLSKSLRQAMNVGGEQQKQNKLASVRS